MLRELSLRVRELSGHCYSGWRYLHSLRYRELSQLHQQHVLCLVRRRAVSLRPGRSLRHVRSAWLCFLLQQQCLRDLLALIHPDSPHQHLCLVCVIRLRPLLLSERLLSVRRWLPVGEHGDLLSVPLPVHDLQHPGSLLVPVLPAPLRPSTNWYWQLLHMRNPALHRVLRQGDMHGMPGLVQSPVKLVRPEP